MKTKTICAITTPLATSAVGIVRLSGKESASILKKCFALASGGEFEHAKLHYGKFFVDYNGTQFVDNCLAVIFFAPKSFTGEEMAEIHCHGGIAVVSGILQTLIKNGARLAERGEFTKRAFLNGKLDLTGAEGISDLIFANSLSEARAAGKLADGELFKKIDQMQSTVLDSLSHLEVLLDYPEEDINPILQSQLQSQIEDIQSSLQALCKTFDSGKKISNGVRVVLAGKTNAGKSSLFNALLGFDRAIVSDIEGTTRDTVEDEYEYNGVIFRLIDTAGLRNSSDKIENLGIERTKKEIESADIILQLDETDIPNANSIKLNAKSDLIEVRQADKFYISAKTGENVEKLKQTIFEKVFSENIQNQFIVTNLRHFSALQSCLTCTQNLLESFEQKPCDVLAMQLKSLWTELGTVTGSTASEEIINNIFAKFCLGK